MIGNLGLPNDIPVPSALEVQETLEVSGKLLALGKARENLMLLKELTDLITVHVEALGLAHSRVAAAKHLQQLELVHAQPATAVFTIPANNPLADVRMGASLEPHSISDMNSLSLIDTPSVESQLQSSIITDRLSFWKTLNKLWIKTLVSRSLADEFQCGDWIWLREVVEGWSNVLECYGLVGYEMGLWVKDILVAIESGRRDQAPQ